MNIFNAAGTALLGTNGYVVRKSNLISGTLTVTSFNLMVGGSEQVLLLHRELIMMIRLRLKDISSVLTMQHSVFVMKESQIRVQLLQFPEI